MKRILSLILSLILAVSILPVSAENSEAETNNDFEILKCLGIVDWETDGSVTRGEFIKVVADLVIDYDAKMYESYKPFGFDLKKKLLSLLRGSKKQLPAAR